MQKQYLIARKKIISNDVWHAPIKVYLTLALKGFVVKNQIPNLNLNPFYHNTCILYLNE
jgi:hypothetical protein